MPSHFPIKRTHSHMKSPIGMVVDFRKINEQPRYWSYLLIRTDRIFSKLNGEKLFPPLDSDHAITA